MTTRIKPTAYIRTISNQQAATNNALVTKRELPSSPCSLRTENQQQSATPTNTTINATINTTINVTKPITLQA
jgi:hypothetical protein